VQIRIDPNVAHRIYDQIHRDSDFLCSQGIMDYSLLMGIQNSEYFVDTTELMSNKGGEFLFTQAATSVAGPCLYHFGIIDFLQQWYVQIDPCIPGLAEGANDALGAILRTMEKKMERFYKCFFKRKDPDGVSALPPKPYKFRFQQKMSRIFALTTHMRAENNTIFHHNYPALVDVLDQGDFATQRGGTFANQDDRRPTFNPDPQNVRLV
jgi:1-phosphatidylinositol-4-phosphate 5-kinase